MTSRTGSGPSGGSSVSRDELLATLKSGVGWAVAAGLIAALVTLLLQVNSTPVFRAQSTLLLTKEGAEGVATESHLLAPRLSPQTYQATIPTPSVLARAYDEGPGEAVRLGVEVTVEDAAQSALLHISVRSNDPERARRIADAVAEATIDWDVARAQSVAEDGVTTLEQQLSALRRQRRQEELPAAQAARLDRMIDERVGELQRARTLVTAADTPLRIVQSARTPNSPSSPRPVRNTILVGLLAAFAGFGVILLLRAARRD